MGRSLPTADGNRKRAALLRLDQPQRHLTALRLGERGSLPQQGAARPTGLVVRRALIAAEDLRQARLLAVGHPGDGDLKALRENLLLYPPRWTLFDRCDLRLDEEGGP